MNIHQLELRDPCYQNRMNPGFLPQPPGQVCHQPWNFQRRRWCVNHLPGNRVDDVILYMPVFAASPSDTPHQAFMNFPNQPFGNRFSAAQVVRYQLKGIPIVQEFPLIFRIDPANRSPASSRFD